MDTDTLITPTKHPVWTMADRLRKARVDAGLTASHDGPTVETLPVAS